MRRPVLSEVQACVLACLAGGPGLELLEEALLERSVGAPALQGKVSPHTCSGPCSASAPTSASSSTPSAACSKVRLGACAGWAPCCWAACWPAAKHY